MERTQLVVSVMGHHQTYRLSSRRWGSSPQSRSQPEERRAVRPRNIGHPPSLKLDLAWARRHSDWLEKHRHLPAEFGQTLFVLLVAVARCLAGDGWECHAGVSALSQLLGLSWGGKFGEEVTPLRAECPPQGTGT